MHRKIIATFATLVLLAAPKFTYAAPTLQDANGIPVADGEQPARSCYLHAMRFWNNVMLSKPHSHQYLNWSYRAFAGCAKIAIATAKILPNGEKIPWFTDYFADTVGATYAQLQLAAITTSKEHCSHLSIAHDLANQALQTGGVASFAPDPRPQSDLQSLSDSIKTQALACGVKGLSS